MKTVSIIIPVHNTEEYIEQCVLSALSQTYMHIEVIIVNDCSQDNSLQVIQQLQSHDKRIKIFNFEERLGAGAARNYAIEQAEGDFIYFLDSDDYLPENTIQYLVDQIGEHNLVRGRMKATNFASSFAIVFDGVFTTKMFSENRFNLLKDYSATNFLISKQFIQENDLKFSEFVEIYCDLNFMLPALSLVETIPYVKEALYFKRNRQDPIKNPSLNQYSRETLIWNFLKMYELQKSKHSDIMVNFFLDTHLLNFYRDHIVTYVKQHNNLNSFHDLLSKAINQLDLILLKKYDWVLKREIKTLLNAGQDKYRKIMKRHNFYRDLKEGLKSKNKFYNFLYENFFIKLPIKEKLIFFESFSGKSYSDNPKYIYEYLLKTHPDKRFVWSFNDKNKLSQKTKQVKRLGLKYFYHLARSKYWITNARMPNHITKRKDCIYLQTWHGTPLKQLAGDLENIYMPGTNAATYKRNFSNETSKWDYLVSPNAYSSKIFKRAFWFEGELLEYGYPRNDVLYNKNNSKDIQVIKEHLNIPTDKKVVLYAPTWRDDEYYQAGKYRFTLKLDLEKMQKHLGDEYVIILRMHYLIASELNIDGYQSFVYDFSNHTDIAELYLISDLLITDYSSVFFDYANLQRPILFYTYDLDKYRDNLRGFYLDIENDVPGPLLKNTEEIIQAIENIDDINISFASTYEEFYNKFCKWDNGNASKKIVDTIIK